MKVHLFFIFHYFADRWTKFLQINLRTVWIFGHNEWENIHLFFIKFHIHKLIFKIKKYHLKGELNFIEMFTFFRKRCTPLNICSLFVLFISYFNHFLSSEIYYYCCFLYIQLPTVQWDTREIGFLHAVFYIGYIITHIPGGYLTTIWASHR